MQSKNRKEIDELFEYVYNAIMNNIGKFQKYDPWYDQNIYTSIVASGITDIRKNVCRIGLCAAGNLSLGKFPLCKELSRALFPELRAFSSDK